MTNYLERKISGIDDADFKILITELCGCVCLCEGEFENKSLANLLTAIVTERKKMDLQQVLIDWILTKKVKELALGSVVYGVCCELASRNGKPMDDLAGKSVFALIKQCHKAVCPALPRPKKPTRLQRKCQFTTALILSRRRNDSYC